MATPSVDAVILPGWMDRDVAIAYLRDQCLFEPPLDQQQAEAIWVQYYDRVQALQIRNVKPPTRFSIPPGDKGHTTDFLKRHRGPEVTDVIKINPLELVIYQLYVVTDRANDHHKQTGAWTRKTLVIDRPSVSLPLKVEGDTLKLALPHAEHMIGIQPDGAFRIQQGGGFVSVADMGGGRLVLKAGYHRSFAFARATMKEPDAKDRCELVALTSTLPPELCANFPTHQGLRTTVFGSRPPLFSDFFDSDLAMSVKLRKKRWEAHIRITAIDDL
jgi:hypothetical protein